jgi:hypothetical protein
MGGEAKTFDSVIVQNVWAAGLGFSGNAEKSAQLKIQHKHRFVNRWGPEAGLGGRATVEDLHESHACH